MREQSLTPIVSARRVFAGWIGFGLLGIPFVLSDGSNLIAPPAAFLVAAVLGVGALFVLARRRPATPVWWQTMLAATVASAAFGLVRTLLVDVSVAYVVLGTVLGAYAGLRFGGGLALLVYAARGRLPAVR